MTDRDVKLTPDERFLLTASPHLKSPDSTPKIMWNVVGSLVPIILVAIYFFGPSAILVMAASILGCLSVEYFFGPVFRLGIFGPVKGGRQNADHFDTGRVFGIADGIFERLREWGHDGINAAFHKRDQ